MGKIRTSEAPVNIMVMGSTGAGKTSFINLASGSELRTSSGLESCTEQIQLASPFTLDGHSVTLVDTPGFDDTTKSDSEILTIITDYVLSEYDKGNRFTGVIYLHRITDNRLGGAALRNFRFFCQLCGNDALPNSALVTNMWNSISLEIAEARESELKQKDIFFKPALDAGAKLLRHDGTVESAHAILRQLITNPPCTLLLQREIIEERKHISETAAGVALLGELALAEQKFREQMRELLKEIDEAIKQNDEADRLELEENRRRLEAQHARREEAERTIKEAPMYKRPTIWRKLRDIISSILCIPGRRGLTQTSIV
ncbi:hypothetical protein CERSUDRAFT_97805 [Gelatoporia subvermispora B]|uniref:G domain-containing protein n=1 Tax=Ceriporiopsis subvermispora (strain B) TaxID=914234 RepID=M2PDJ0_CERS8|nr:hypothetical protein CERSUDRAFT_97805 [Gelatoporia subvermispora B]